jgi:hypothetical protein
MIDFKIIKKCLKSCVLFLPLLIFSSCLKNENSVDFPVAWTTYKKVESEKKDFEDIKAHGIGLVSIKVKNVSDAKEKLQLARETGMKYHTEFPDIKENSELVRKEGL